VPEDPPPLLITFVAGTALHRERDRPSDLPIVRNGPPGTFVDFSDGLRVSLPTDQIVFAADTDGAVRVGFGGMQFVGLDNGTLMFRRVRDLQPEAQLSPDRSWTMMLQPAWVASIESDGQVVWPRRD
jgi:hypothetical protein